MQSATSINYKKEISRRFYLLIIYYCHKNILNFFLLQAIHLEMEIKYYIDTLIILSKQKKKQLNKRLPIDTIRSHCSYFMIKEKPNNTHYCCVLIIPQPSNEVLKMLVEHEIAISPYYIYKVEFAKDTIAQDKKESIELLDNLSKTTTKKYANNHFIYESKDNITEEKYNDKNFYANNKSFKYTAYARLSKLNGTPCLHEELRIQGSSNIKRLLKLEELNLETVLDIISLSKEIYESLYSHYMRQEKINLHNLGRFLSYGNIKKKKNDNSNILRKAERFLRKQGIKTAGELRDHFKQKKELYPELNNYFLNKFFNTKKTVFNL